MPQETNMAELLRLMHTMIGKFNDLDVKVDDLSRDMKVVKSDVQVLKTDVKKLDTRMDRLEVKLDTVVGKVSENTQRTTSLEGRVDILESKSH